MSSAAPRVGSDDIVVLCLIVIYLVSAHRVADPRPCRNDIRVAFNGAECPVKQRNVTDYVPADLDRGETSARVKGFGGVFAVSRRK